MFCNKFASEMLQNLLFLSGVSFPVFFNVYVIMYIDGVMCKIEVNIHCEICKGVFYIGKAKLASRNKGTACMGSAFSWDLFVPQTCFLTLNIFQHFVTFSSLRCCCHCTVVLLN